MILVEGKETMKKYLISVIIPTRNRQTYAEAAVRNAISISDNIQVIINDNSDDNSLKSLIVDLLESDQIVYNYIDKRIAGVNNYDIAASFAQGEFFIAIGDDDALLPSIIDCAKWMKDYSIDGVKPNKKSNYWWPDTRRSDKKANGGLFISGLTDTIKQLDTYEGVHDLLRNGGQGYLGLPLIGSYHCLVRASCMEEVKQITGHYYAGLSPDMFSAICLSLLPNKRYVEIGMPISLPGVCPKSTSAASVDGKHVGRLEDAPHFVGLLEPYTWDDRIPHYYCVETIWSETLFKAIEAMDNSQLIEDYFSYEKLYGFMIANNRKYFSEFKKYLSTDVVPYEFPEVCDSILKKIASKIDGGWKRIQHQNFVFANCPNINEAVNIFDSILSKGINRKRWNKIYCSTKELK